jgi:hypothetical protein
MLPMGQNTNRSGMEVFEGAAFFPLVKLSSITG